MRSLALLTGCALLAAACADPAPRPAVSHRKLELRPTNPNAPLWRYGADDVVEQFDHAAGRVRVHFTREGQHAVPAADEDGSGVPDYVELVADTYEEVLAFYADAGYRAPLSDADLAGENGGDGRFDVYLLDFARQSDGSFDGDACSEGSPTVCVGHVIQENDFAGYGYPSARFATRVLASHEVFHAIQDAYDAAQGVIVSEATAVWASDTFDPDLNEVASFSAGYLGDPGRSLDVPPAGPVPRFAYGCGLFFQFLAERYDPGLVRALWEHVEDGQGLAGGGDEADPQWLVQLGRLLEVEHGSSFAEAFAEFARWNLYTGGHADPAVAYAKGARYAAVAVETVQAPFSDDRLRVFHASAQYYAAGAGGRGEMTAALLATPGPEDDLDGVELLLAVERGGAWSEVVGAEDPAAAPVLDTTGASGFVAVVINTNAAGDSRRPAFCLGSPEEVEACGAEVLGEPDAGAPDAAAPDASPDPADAEAPTSPDAELPDAGPRVGSGGSDGCVVAPRGSECFGPALLFLPALVRRRRRPEGSVSRWRGAVGRGPS